MQPILLATDGSPTAAKATSTAIELAEAFGSELVIVSVWDVAYGATRFGAIPVSVELAKLGEAEASRAAAEAAARAKEAGIDARTVVRRGFPVEAICAIAEDFQPRMLVLGSHGWGAVKRAVFGSVSTGVLHRAACPVLVVPGTAAEQKARNDAEATVA